MGKPCRKKGSGMLAVAGGLTTEPAVAVRQGVTDLWHEVRSWFHESLFEIGKTEVTAAGILRVVVIWLLAWWLAKFTVQALNRMAAKRQVVISPPSLYALSRVIHYTIVVVGLIIGLSSIGIDFSNFALLASALGVGIGLGLQSIVNNFVSGLFILFEKSLKVGDLIELASGVVGEVREINFRNTRITTADNIDVLVPNSEFVNGRVTNWTLDDSVSRIRLPFGVAYSADKEEVRRVALAVAAGLPHTLKGAAEQAPQVWLKGLGESSLDFELVVWLTPAAGRQLAVVRSDYLWAIHDALVAHGIEIPFPRRDVRLLPEQREG